MRPRAVRQIGHARKLLRVANVPRDQAPPVYAGPIRYAPVTRAAMPSAAAAAASARSGASSGRAPLGSSASCAKVGIRVTRR